MKLAIVAAIVALLASCTTAEEIRRPDGRVQYIVACGASLGWNICYERANELCPEGYTDVSKEAGFNRKELTIDCGVKGE